MLASMVLLFPPKRGKLVCLLILAMIPLGLFIIGSRDLKPNPLLIDVDHDPPVETSPDPSPLTPESEDFEPQSYFLLNNPFLCNLRQNAVINSNESTANLIVVIVYTTRANFENRDLIRKTWGFQKDLPNWSILSIIFILGEEVGGKENPESIKKLKEESQQHGDLIMGDFQDTIRNRSIKATSAYTWLLEYCPGPKVVLKTDDNVVINLPKLIQELNNLPGIVDSPKMYCNVRINQSVIRDVNNSHYVSFQDYPNELYPPFCDGLGYVTTMEVVSMVGSVLDTLKKPNFPIDDVFMTGVVVERYNKILGISSGNITHVQKLKEWFFHPNETYKDFWKLDDKNRTGMRDFSKIFFPIPHGPQFKENWLGIWARIGEDDKITENKVT